MERSLVVGIDGSEGSLAALDWAVDEAQRANLPLRLVHASLWERYEGGQADRDDQRSDEQELVEDLVAAAGERVSRLASGVAVSTTVRPEDPVGALLSESRNAAMVIVGSRGRGQIRAMLLGSTSLAVAGQASCAVVVVRGGKENRAAEKGNVMLGVGESPGATVPARFALHEAGLRGSSLTAVKAWRVPAHQAAPPYPLAADETWRACRQEAVERIHAVLDVVCDDYPDVHVEPVAVQGAPHQSLIEASADADLLVVGSRHRHGVAGLQLGRVTHTVLHHAACPVAVVPETR